MSALILLVLPNPEGVDTTRHEDWKAARAIAQAVLTRRLSLVVIGDPLHLGMPLQGDVHRFVPSSERSGITNPDHVAVDALLEDVRTQRIVVISNGCPRKNAAMQAMMFMERRFGSAGDPVPEVTFVGGQATERDDFMGMFIGAWDGTRTVAHAASVAISSPCTMLGI